MKGFRSLMADHIDKSGGISLTNMRCNFGEVKQTAAKVGQTLAHPKKTCYQYYQRASSYYIVIKSFLLPIIFHVLFFYFASGYGMSCTLKTNKFALQSYCLFVFSKCPLSTWSQNFDISKPAIQKKRSIRHFWILFTEVLRTNEGISSW